MSLVNSENYITIQGWMINDLHLSGNSLLVYAIIYGYSQDGESSFKGSLQYLADWCNATKQGIQKNLKELLDRCLISKQEHIINNQKFCEYSCIPCNKVAYPMQQSCINNIEDTIDKKEKLNNKLFSTEDSKPKRVKKANLYEKCNDYIMQYTNNVVLQEKLKTYLTLRLEIAKGDSKPFYYNMWPPIINELDELAKDTNTAVKIVEQSIRCGWRKFFPLKEYNNKSNIKANSSESGVTSEHETEAEYNKRMELAKRREEAGEQSVF